MLRARACMNIRLYFSGVLTYVPLAFVLVCTDQFIHLTAIRWLSDFVLLAHVLLLPYVANMVNVILPSIAHQGEGRSL